MDFNPPPHQRRGGHMRSALNGDAGHATGRAGNWSELSRRGRCVWVGVGNLVHVSGRRPPYRVPHIKVADEANAGGK